MAALTEARVRAIVREELVALLTPGRTSAAAKAPASTKASSTAKPNAFVEEVIRAPRAHVCTAPQACGKVFKSAERAASHWHAGDPR